MTDINLFLKPETTLKLSNDTNCLITAPSFIHPTIGDSLSNLSNFLDPEDFGHNGSNVILKTLSYAKMSDIPSLGLESSSAGITIEEPFGYPTAEIDITGGTITPVVIDIDYKYLAFPYVPAYPKLTADSTNLKAHYKFDDNYNDEISGNNIVPSANSSFITDSKVNKAVNIPSGQYITVPKESCYPLFREVQSGNTLALWFKMNSSTNFLLGVYKSGYDRYLIQIVTYEPYKIYWIRQDDRSSGTSYKGHSVNFIPPSDIFDTWHHLVLVGDWDGINITSKVYLDGIEQTLTVITGTNTWNDPLDYLEDETLILGGYNQPSYDNYNGIQQLDDFRIYDKALSQEEITQLNTIPTSTSYTLSVPTAGTECSALIIGNLTYNYEETLKLSGDYTIVVGETSSISNISTSISYDSGTSEELPITNSITNTASTYNSNLPYVIIKYKLTLSSTIVEPVVEPSIERMYPPVRNFTTANFTVSEQEYGIGLYNVTYSSTYGILNTVDYSPFKCFNESDNIGGSWAVDQYTNGTYDGTSNITSSYNGEWLKIKLPVPIKLTRYNFLQRTELQSYINRSPKDFKIYGSNDNTIWTMLTEKSTITYINNRYEEILPNPQNYYTYYALVVNKLLGTGEDAILLNFDEWYIYGKEQITPEVIPNTDYKYLAFPYTVANAYPTLAADSTNLKAHYKFDGDFNDSSGNNAHLTQTNATIVDGLIVQSTDVDGTAFLTTTSINLNSTNIYSISCWVRFDNTPTANVFIWAQGSTPGTGKVVSLLYQKASDVLTFSHYGTGNDMDSSGYNMLTTIGTNWHHYVVTYNYNNKAGTIWFDGVKLTTNISTMSTVFSGTGPFTIAKASLSEGNLNGLIDDFRIYDKVLSQEEITQLYNIQDQTEYSVTFDEPSGTECDILIVGGGGGGGGVGAGTRGGGGGGAGQFRYLQTQTISNNSLVEIKVGKGGSGATGIGNGTNGSESSILINGTLYDSIGGGGGAKGQGGTASQGLSGASGGGGVGNNDVTYSNPSEYGGAPTIAYINDDTLYTGFDGGKGGGNYHGGGGGGYNGPGGNAITGFAGNGGIGIDNNITGEYIGYAGGGGGGVYIGYVNSENTNPEQAGNATFRGGKGGGYDVALTNKYSIRTSGANGKDAVNGSGSGGGGATAGTDSIKNGGNGGSGIVIIRYKYTTTSTTSTPYKPPAVLKYLTTTKWQPIINPTSTSDFSMTLDLTSSNFDTTTSTYTTYFDMEHSNIYNKNTDNYRVILNASVDDGDKYVLSTLYYNENPLFFEYCNITPTTDWFYSNLTIGDSKKLRISVITTNEITKINVKM